MPRNRKDPKLDWLPPRVYIQRDRYVFQPKTGGKVTLSKVSDGKLACIKNYELALDKIVNKQHFKYLVEEFLKSAMFKKLSPRTQKDYRSYCVIINEVFGKSDPKQLRPDHVWRFVNGLAKKKGTKDKPANATANRHKACLQKICSWAVLNYKMKENLCAQVPKLDEKPRERYITDDEYSKIYNAAVPSCRAAMEISYLCMARISDVIDLKLTDLLEDGLFIQQGKTGKKQIKLYSERLQAAIELAKSLPCKDGMFTMFLFNKPDGSRYTVRAIQAQYKKACIAAGVEGVTLHDLKAKGISDLEGTLAEKSDAAGHTNLNMTKRYDRKTKKVPSVR